MSTEEVWISNIFNDSTIVRGTDIDRTEPGWNITFETHAPPPEDVPLNLYATYKNDKLNDLPPVFEGAGGMKISEPVAKILKQFDLGNGFLAPVRLYLHDRTTPVDKSYFVYGPYERKDGCFIPELSKDIRTNPYEKNKPPKEWDMPWEPKDSDIAVMESALDGSDIWLDRTLRGALFMKGTMVAALQQAGYGRIFKAKKCRVVLLQQS
mgnify:CR=1 FL=1